MSKKNVMVVLRKGDHLLYRQEGAHEHEHEMKASFFGWLVLAVWCIVKKSSIIMQEMLKNQTPSSVSRREWKESSAHKRSYASGRPNYGVIRRPILRVTGSYLSVAGELGAHAMPYHGGSCCMSSLVVQLGATDT